jgi:hypothetical protein
MQLGIGLERNQVPGRFGRQTIAEWRNNMFHQILI